MNNQNINFIRRIFLEKISRSLILINDITTYKEFRGGGYRPIFEKTKYLIIELVFF